MLDFNDIQKYLPQRFPMMMVDRVLEYEKGRTLKAVKNISANDIFFLGHFPGKPIMPGALILEGFGQSASILYQITFGMMPQDEIPLYGSVNARFYKTVIPGDQLVYEIEAIKITSFAGLFKAVGKVESEIVAKAEIGLGKRRSADKPTERTRKNEIERASETGRRSESDPLVITFA